VFISVALSAFSIFGLVVTALLSFALFGMPFTPVISTLSQLQNSLKRIYDPDYFELHQNYRAPFYQMLQQSRNHEADGEGAFWPFYLATPQNQGSPAEAGDLPPTKPRTEVQARVRPIQFTNSFEISFILAAVGTKRGSFSKTEIQRHMWEATTDVTKHMNRVMAGSHGSGRLGQVNAGTAASTSFVMKQPWGILLLRPNMLIDVYTLDVGGAISSAGAATQIKIDSLVRATNTVNMNTALTLAANEHVYLYPDYNNTSNGLLGLVDDGTFLTTIHNQSRTSFEDLKATVLDNGGTLRPLTEELLIDGASQVLQNSGQEVDCLLMNSGQMRQYLKFVIPQRRYNVTGKGVPAYNTGYREDDLQFLWGGKTCHIKRMEDILPRNVFGITTDKIRRFEVEKLDWYPQGNGILAQGVGATGYKTTQKATIYSVTNIGNLQPNAHFVIRDLLDPQLSGDPAE